MTIVSPLIDIEGTSPGVPTRSYDFDKGDRRFFEFERAIEHSEEEAIRTGVRQAIRRDLSDIPGGDKLYLVQAVGS